jgi:hypothetical protein
VLTQEQWIIQLAGADLAWRSVRAVARRRSLNEAFDDATFAPLNP